MWFMIANNNVYFIHFLSDNGLDYTALQNAVTSNFDDTDSPMQIGMEGNNTSSVSNVKRDVCNGNGYLRTFAPISSLLPWHSWTPFFLHHYHAYGFSSSDVDMCPELLDISSNCALAKEKGLALDDEARSLCIRHEVCYTCVSTDSFNIPDFRCVKQKHCDIHNGTQRWMSKFQILLASFFLSPCKSLLMGDW